MIPIESGGDNLADLTIYVIDTAAGQDIPRKKGPGLTRSDILVVNKLDLAPYVGVDETLLATDTKAARAGRPHALKSFRQGKGVADIVKFIERASGFQPAEVSASAVRPVMTRPCSFRRASAASR